MSAPAVPALRALEVQAEPWPELAGVLEVESQDGLDVAGELLGQIKALRRAIEDGCRPVIRAAKAAHDAALEQLRKLDDPLARAEGEIKRKVSAYVAAQRVRALEEQRRLEAEQLEQKRAAEQVAKRLEAEGATTAAALVRSASPAPAPAPEAEKSKAAGLALRVTWGARVLDKRKLLEAIVAGLAPLELLEIDARLLAELAKRADGKLELPGVETFQIDTVAAGRGRKGG